MKLWEKYKKIISIVVENNSWFHTFAQEFYQKLISQGYNVELVTHHEEISAKGIAFFLSYEKIVPQSILDLNYKNIVVHASSLPKGKGFSPLTWQILEGKNQIPICLLEASDKVDSGSVIYRDYINFKGHELIDEMRKILGDKVIELCERYLNENHEPKGEIQTGESTFYGRRKPEDSELDPQKSIAEQFNLLRVVDNKKYPAYFQLLGNTYKIEVSKIEK